MRIIAGKFRGQLLTSPKGSATRPTASRLRESLFNIVQTEIEGARFLDIFAGSGAMGIEALSRGALHATFIDKSKEALFAIEANIKRLDLKKETTILFGDFLKMLDRLEQNDQQFDIIYADAPYGLHTKTESASQLLLDWFSNHRLLKDEGLLFIEDDSEKPPTSPLQSLVHLNTRRSGKAFLHQYRKVV